MWGAAAVATSDVAGGMAGPSSRPGPAVQPQPLHGHVSGGQQQRAEDFTWAEPPSHGGPATA